MRELQADEGAVARRARDLLAKHAHFRGRTEMFVFECSENVLVIRGCVPTFYLKQLLQTELKKVEGVQRVDNRVDVYAFETTSVGSPVQACS
jgi:hypothetical protein